MKQIQIKVTTMSPIVLSSEGNTTVMTETYDSINGSVLRGVIAKQYIATRNLGEEAHRDEKFRRLFFDTLRFIDANLACPDDGGRSFVLPLSMQKEKAIAKQTEKIEDLMRAGTPTKGMKALRGYAVLTGEGTIRKIDVSKEVSMHMSRMGEDERKKGRSVEGGIYNYESISAGQSFIGFIIGEETALSELCGNLPESFECRIGRSKFTQYGRCRMDIGQPEDIPTISAKDIEADESMILRFDSPFLYDELEGFQAEQNGRYTTATTKSAVDSVASAMNRRTGGNAFSIGKIFAADAEVGNYVGVWGMKRPREHALAAGTVFALVKQSSWTEPDFAALTDMMYQGVGRRTEEGFGQIRHWPKPSRQWEKTQKAEPKEVQPLPFATASASVAEIARKAFARRIIEQIRIDAASDAKDSVHDRKAEGLSGLTHFFSRLEEILVNAKNETDGRDGLRARYSKKLKDEIPPKGPLADNLRKIRINNRSLHDMLVEGWGVPYEDSSVRELLGVEENKIKTFMKAIGLEEQAIDLSDGHYFYEYWHRFFRYARKRAATKQKEAKHDA